MEEPNATQGDLDYLAEGGDMSAYARMEITKVANPKCFADRRSYNYFSPACKTCSVVNICSDKIEIDGLLADLPGDVEDSQPQVSSESHVHIEERPTYEDQVALTVALSEASKAEVASYVTPSYEFPAPNSRRYITFANGALVDELNALIRRGLLTTSCKHYDSVRADICAIHIEMNLRQRHAPRFRPQPPLPHKAKSIAEQTLARDRQVIDIHWRANSSNKPMVSVSKFEGIFDSEAFDFRLANDFAQLDWRQQTKVIQLHLTEEMQWEHAIIQNPNIRDKWRTIQRGDLRGHMVKQAGAPQVQTRLHQSMADMPQLRKHIPGLMKVWIARRFVGDSPSRVARFAALISGDEVRDASAARRAMATLDKRLASAKALHRKS